MQQLHLQPLLHDEQCINVGVASQLELQWPQTLPVFGPEPYKHPKTTKLNPNTPWMKCNKKTINIAYDCFLPSMNHSRFMKIQNSCQLFCPTCFIRISIPIFGIPCRLELSCICATSGSNNPLQVFIFLHSRCCISRHTAHTPSSKPQHFQQLL